MVLNDTIQKIEAICKSSDALTSEQKAELSALVGQLKSELQDIAQTNQAQADSIAGFASLAAHEHLRTDVQSEQQELATKGLESSIHSFRATHPQLMRVIRQIINTFSNLGV